MIPNDYIQGRLAQAHRQDLLREAEYRRLLAQLPHSNNLQMLLRLLLPWRTLRVRVQKLLHRRIH